MESGLLKLHERRDRSGCNNHAWKYVIGQFSGECLERQFVWVRSGIDQFLGGLPDGVMTAQKNGTPSLQHGDASVMWRQDPRRIS